MISRITPKNCFVVPMLVSLVLIIGCSSTKPMQTTVKTGNNAKNNTDSIAISNPIEINIPLPHNRSELSSYKAECDVMVENESAPMQGTCTLSILRTDSLLMQIGGPFGILVGKLSASPTNMIYLDALRSEVFEGNPQNPEMQAKLPIPLSYEDIIYLMRAEVPFMTNNYTFVKESDGKQVFTNTTNSQFIDFVQMSTKDSTMLTYQRKSKTGELLFNVNYNEYATKNNIRYPISISLHFPMRKLQAKFIVTDMLLNSTAERYWFNVPKNIKRTKL